MTAYIAGYARTPFAKFTGQLASVTAVDLGAHASRAALQRAGVAPEEVEQVYFGQVLQAGAGQNPARQTAVKAGVPLGVPALTLNAVCLSGLEAVSAAARLIAAGEADVVLAGGQESMSLAPHVVHMRAGQKFGPAKLIDSADHDGLTDAFDHTSMGLATEPGNAERGLGRERQDEYAAASHQRATEQEQFLAEEIAPFTLTSRRGDVEVTSDDGVRADTTAESLGRLRPAFKENGTITAGSASQITDGAAALVLVSERYLERSGLTPLAKIEAHALVAGPDTSLHAQPANAILKALSRTEISVDELAAVEINEAFAAVVLASIDELGIDPQIVNPNGGAIALGHPIGASGARIVGTLARQLAREKAGAVGAAGICGGGGQGSAMIIRAL